MECNGLTKRVFKRITSMKRILFFVGLMLMASLSSCQCSDKPEIGPVEETSGLEQVAVEQFLA